MILSTLFLLVELAILFYSVAFLIQLLQRRIGRERLRNWMGGTPMIAAIKGIAVGFITPFCTYSAVPMLIGLRQAGVPPAGYVSFIVAAPVLDPVLFGALVIIVGVKIAIVYACVAFVAAFSLGLLAEYVDISTQLKAIPLGGVRHGIENSACCKTSASDRINSASGDFLEIPWRTLKTELPLAAKAAANLLRSVGPLLLVGVLLGLLITFFLSPETVSALSRGSGMFAIPVAAAIGIPLYTSTAVLVPIADSLNSVGLGLGAIVAFTIAASGANIPEFVLLTRFFRTRLVSVFFLYVFSVAVVGGLIAQSFVM